MQLHILKPEQITSSHVLSLSFFTNCTSRYEIKPQWIKRALRNQIQVLKEFHQIKPRRYNRALQNHKQVVKQFQSVKRLPLSTSHYDPNTNSWRHRYRKADYKQRTNYCAALTLIVLMWRIGWAHNNARK